MFQLGKTKVREGSVHTYKVVLNGKL